ncbi:2-succinyl-6-hydroxy-2,4-cyclohexadiene-1-carboxylate synthase [Bacillus tropicus]|uniref:2-succinyl-6-hydroxy-2, 4-cyclohexadiene-1-carboxylate synthase n=1 Tax=Bacillus cereus group TaxID=86661 RepID=UPI0005E5CC33|nr:MULTISPECIES: 2-succinyl-6-hydroxy-2,4-cyclohexadiene-1-carboxylate synthase [Bacillus cereus group]MCC2341091.1 2-succinyl-6-hydroxy-2,4-cyclohexadiene-1-carboxylate synthase [Bacillus tropicus]MCU5424210.1 2-succinyl-6-hydroxy-2,4-cyclohexadiene-1-carboxylate synthase [Bacillus tropicus]MDA1780315.1 2-succinyl-6-hydroxy-2,4-cyclohexadiene-1-carboxylate synthase [Bacillus cereus group sp. BY9-3LC]CJV67837.1 Hydrolase%2C alpha/beta hydrolase fold family [Streptococcus pneumoniae]
MNVTLQGVSYEYEVVGSGEPLLLLHGFTGSMETWRSFVPSWSEQFQVILVDIVGHGKTESPEDVTHYDIRNAALQMKELLDFLHIEKAHILGYSMGGRLAITMACLYPEYVRSLLLENCTAGLESEDEREERREKDERLADKIEREGIESFVTMWENIPLFETQKSLVQNVQEAVRKERLANNPKGLANSLRGMGTGAQPSWWNELPNLKMPVLLMNGEYDEKFFRILKNIEKCVSDAKFVKIDGAGHAIHVEQPEKFDTIVKGFLKTMQ